MACRRRQRHLPADDGGGLEQALRLNWQPVHARGQDRLHRGRHLQAEERLCQAIGPSLTDQPLRFHQRLDALLQKQGIPLGALDQALSERLEAGVLSQEGRQEFVGMRRGQRVEPELGVVGLAPPAVLVLGTIA